MKQREWSMPVRASSQGQPGQSSNPSGPSRPGGLVEFVEYVKRFISCMIFFGAIGFLFSSWFPVALGLFLFFTDGEFIDWALRKVGIRLVPDTLGSEFVKALVFVFGSWILITYWKDSAPAWLLPWIPPSDASWYLIGGAALFFAVLQIISVAVVRKLLPRFKIEIAPGRQSWAILVVLGMLIGLLMLALFIFGY